MRNGFRWFYLAMLIAGLALTVMPAPSRAAGRHVDVVALKGVVNPVSAGYIERGITTATQDGATALIITMDTPGGLGSSMDEIIQAILASNVPVAVFVSPGGARAGSAGVYITYAAHIAAMAPNTNIGAAHPVFADSSGNEQQVSDEMKAKVTNDAAAQIRNLATTRGRNVDWADQAVRQSVSVTYKEALDLRVIDIVASDIPDLLRQMDGRTVKMGANLTPTVINTAGASINNLEMGFFEQALFAISSPDIAFLLLSLGGLGLFFELANPGSVFPGVLGGLFILLAFFSLGTLPVNYAGVAFIGFAFVLLIADLFLPTHGVLTFGGVVSLILGGAMLIDTSGPYTISAGVDPWVLITVALVLGGFFAFGVAKAVQARLKPPATGRERLIGALAEVRVPLKPHGMVFLEGQLWGAVSNEGDAPAGSLVRVVAINGLTLTVALTTLAQVEQPTASLRG
jgi:membrane-bound serine protease (ClpP class)